MLKTIKNGTDSIKELFTLYLVGVLIVSVLFMLIEKHTFIDSVWWTFVTGLTIGYGDIYPMTVAGKVLTVIWANLAVLFIIPMFIGRVITTMMENKNEFTDSEQKEVLRLLRKMDKNKNPNVQAVRDFITETYGKRCDVPDIVEFPEIIDDPKASRCACCEMWEIYDDWLGGQDSNLR